MGIYYRTVHRPCSATFFLCPQSSPVTLSSSLYTSGTNSDALSANVSIHRALFQGTEYSILRVKMTRCVVLWEFQCLMWRQGQHTRGRLIAVFPGWPFAIQLCAVLPLFYCCHCCQVPYFYLLFSPVFSLCEPVFNYGYWVRGLQTWHS